MSSHAPFLAHFLKDFLDFGKHSVASIHEAIIGLIIIDKLDVDLNLVEVMIEALVLDCLCCVGLDEARGIARDKVDVSIERKQEAQGWST